MAEGRKKRNARGPQPADRRVPVRGDTLVHEVAATDETVLFTKQRGELLLLNDVGAGVFYLIDGRRSVGEIAQLVAEHFPDAREVIDDDVARFVEALASAGAVRFA